MIANNNKQKFFDSVTRISQSVIIYNYDIMNDTEQIIQSKLRIRCSVSQVQSIPVPPRPVQSPKSNAIVHNYNAKYSTLSVQLKPHKVQYSI